MATAPLRAFVRLWRRSIQARVVTGTVVLSALVVGLVGWTLSRQISAGLVEERVESAVAEATRSTADLQGSLSAATPDFDVAARLPPLVSGVVARGTVRGYDVALVGPLSEIPGRSATTGGEFSTPGIRLASVPADLRSRVEEGSLAGAAYTFARLRAGGASGEQAVPGVVVGTRVVLPADGGTYALYHLFPMVPEQRTLDLVHRALVTSGALLLLLVAGVTWVVARHVVTPVRMARQVAEQLASGGLEQRMRVRGEDDIARLAVSFNQMARNLQRQIGQLEDMSAAQRRFVSDVSHELRTPLTTVRMAGHVLHDARGRFDPVTARAAELLQNELDRFETLLVDLLEISRFDAGAAALDAEDVDLVELSRRVVASVEALANARRTRVVVRPLSGPTCVVEADARRVERIVRNLLVNAIEYADSADIVVWLAADAEVGALAVRDYGVGLGPGDEVRAFNRFWRADPARARTTGGTGLGLSIALEDARLHGGWLQGWGSPGGGAQFRLTLPRRAGQVLDHSPLPLVPRDATSRRVVLR